MYKNLYKKIKIGNMTIPNLMSAPLDGIIDSPFRQLIREFSKEELLFTEMRHVSHVANEKTEQCLKYNNKEHPLAFQFSANKTDFIDKAVSMVLEKGFDMINLNCGCPSKSVVKSGSGSALMDDPEKLTRIVAHFHKIIDGRVPFTIKIRAGFKKCNAFEISQLAQDCGVDGIVIHPRTQTGGFSSELDFDLVKKIKQTLSIPIIFSGNLTNLEDINRTYELTGVDGFMIGRALWGAPWKMKEIKNTIQEEKIELEANIALKYAKKHLDLNIKHFGDKGFNAFKKHISQYIKNTPNASQWRVELLRSQNGEEMSNLLKQISQICL